MHKSRFLKSQRYYYFFMTTNTSWDNFSKPAANSKPLQIPSPFKVQAPANYMPPAKSKPASKSKPGVKNNPSAIFKTAATSLPWQPTLGQGLGSGLTKPMATKSGVLCIFCVVKFSQKHTVCDVQPPEHHFRAL